MSDIVPVTFDLLDASIPAKFEQWQSYHDEERWPHYRETFSTDPVLWKRHEPPTWAFSLSWAEFRYASVKGTGHLDELIGSDSPGLYIFYVRPDSTIFHFPRFALYVGISNEGDSGRPLRQRLKDYLPERISQKKKREQIDRMLRLYYGALWVAYTLSDRPSTELELLEQKLHGFIYPPYDRRDFPVDIKTQQKRFGEI
jgi:hypothetical protein